MPPAPVVADAGSISNDPNSPLQLFETVGLGSSRTSPTDSSIVVEAGWGINPPAVLHAAVRLKSTRVLKDAKITVEFRGLTETRWLHGKPAVGSGRRESMSTTSSGGKVTTKGLSSDPPVRNAKRFLQLVKVVRERKEPLEPNEFGIITLPFQIPLPASGLPPSFSDSVGDIMYHLKTTLSFQDSMHFLKTHKEILTPVTIAMPRQARERLVKENDNPLSHTVDATLEKCGYSIRMPKRVVAIGDYIVADVILHSTPGESSVRWISASLRTSKIYQSPESRAAQVKLPRPLSEAMEQVGRPIPGPSRPLARRFSMHVDPKIAVASLESILISVKTVFRVEVVLDTSEVPNIAVEVPVVIVPADSDEMQTTRLASPLPSSIPSSLPSSTTTASSVVSDGASRSPNLNQDSSAPATQQQQPSPSQEASLMQQYRQQQQQLLMQQRDRVQQQQYQQFLQQQQQQQYQLYQQQQQQKMYQQHPIEQEGWKAQQPSYYNAPLLQQQPPSLRTDIPLNRNPSPTVHVADPSQDSPPPFSPYTSASTAVSSIASVRSGASERVVATGNGHGSLWADPNAPYPEQTAALQTLLSFHQQQQQQQQLFANGGSPRPFFPPRGTSQAHLPPHLQQQQQPPAYQQYNPSSQNLAMPPPLQRSPSAPQRAAGRPGSPASASVVGTQSMGFEEFRGSAGYGPSGASGAYGLERNATVSGGGVGAYGVAGGGRSKSFAVPTRRGTAPVGRGLEDEAEAPVVSSAIAEMDMLLAELATLQSEVMTTTASN
ncbi:hypothetical protein DFJ73DRAFT_904583 [Zopfochytrium polystomum]|nr:hypothetical protein DFJ73DRAFT_904583 [Zopfochytrium polystomum]